MKQIAIFVLENLKKITTFLLGVIPVFFIFLAFNTAHAVSPSSTWTEYGTGIYFNASHAGMNTGGPGTNLYFSCPFEVTSTYPYYNSDLDGSTLPTLQWYWHSNPGYTSSTNYLTDYYAASFYAIKTGIDCGSTITVSAYQSDLTPPPPPVSVSLYAPTSTIPDFANWSVNWSGAVVPGTMSVYYGQSTSTMTLHDDVSFSPYVNVSPLPIHKNHLLWQIPMTIPSTWYAEAINTGATSSFFSDIMTFTISPDAAAPPASTDTTLMAPFSGIGGSGVSSTLANPTTNCAFSSSSFLADPIGNIENGICSAFSFLFVPTMPQQQDIAASFNFERSQIQNKPPFGYIGGVVGSFGSFSPATSTTSTPLLDASGTSIFGTAFHALDVGLALILWFLFGWYIVHRAKHIEL